MRIIEIAKTNATLAEYTSDITQAPVIIVNNGQPVAALITLDNVDMETLFLSTNPKFIELIEHSRAQQRSNDGISSVEMRHRLGLSEVKLFKCGRAKVADAGFKLSTATDLSR
jgi:PHD/YefM family antitoxin component YafN of YafNO toxin-antitoxin module